MNLRGFKAHIMKRSLTKEVDKLVKYIKDKTYGTDKWIQVKHRDIPEICQISQYYVPDIFSAVQNRPNIVFKRDMSAKTYNKPLTFKYIDEGDQFESLKGELQYNYIDSGQIEEIYSILKCENYTDFVGYLNMINYLLHLKDNDPNSKLDVDHLLSVYLKSKDDIKAMLDTLNKRKLLSRDGDDYEVTIPKSEGNVINISTSTYVETKTVPEVEEEDEERLTIEDLVDSIDGMNNIISNFQDYLSEQSVALVDHALLELKNSEDSKKEIEEVQKIIDKLIDENNELREKNTKLIDDNDKMKRSLALMKDHEDSFIMQAQQILEIMMAEITNRLSQYAQIPAWQKDEGTNARLQKEVLNAMTSAVDKILKT